MNWLMVSLSVAASVQTQAAQVLDSAAEAEHLAKMQDFKDNDPWGLGVTIISMLIVLTALVVIYFAFKAIGPAIGRAKALKGKAGREKSKVAAASIQPSGNDAEIAAVIGLALYQQLQAMRSDDVINLTIKEISRRYSPWNDKSFAVTNNQIAWLRRRK